MEHAWFGVHSGVRISDGSGSRDVLGVEKATTSHRKIRHVCVETLAAILLVAAVLLTGSASGASSRSTPLCKNVAKFGTVLNDPRSLGRAGFVTLVHLSQKISHEAPRSAEPAWSVVTSDLTKVLQQGGGTKKSVRALGTAVGTAHTAVLKICG
jgi:hypothetical protein